MHSNSKTSPKSCSCTQCRRGKGSEPGKHRMKLDERAFRHAANAQTRLFPCLKGDLDDYDTPSPAPKGNFYD